MFIIHCFLYGLPWWLSSKESACNTGDAGLIPGSRRSPGGGNGNPLQHFLSGKFHGQRSLEGYSPQGRKESATTEHAHVTPQLTDLEYHISTYINYVHFKNADKRHLNSMQSEIRLYIDIDIDLLYFFIYSSVNGP